MRYMLLNDISYIIKEKYKLIVGYLIIFLYYYLWGRSIPDIATSNEFLNVVFGNYINIKQLGSDIILSVFMLLGYGLPILFAIFLFIKDIDDCDNLFLRISVTRWLNTKILSNILIATVLFSIIYVVALLFGTVDIHFFLVIVKKILFVVIIESYIYGIFMLINKNRILAILTGLLLFGCFWVEIDLTVISLSSIGVIFAMVYILLMIIGRYIKFSNLKG